MRITDSSIIMDSTRSFIQKDEMNVNLQVWVDPQSTFQHDTVSLSQQAQSLFEGMQAEYDDMEVGSASDEVSLKALIIEILSGKKIKIMDPSEVTPAKAPPDIQPSSTAQGQAENQRVGWGMRYDYEETHLEREQVDFTASGVIKTQDGQEIGFTLKITMSREFMTQNKVTLQAGDATLMDPLVINYGGNAAELTDKTFAFDIDSDGVEEKLPNLTPGRGFLAFDKNNDGIINNGKELFGPSSGNGFEELATYDTDGNNWIDENDAVFDKLKVMTASEEKTSLTSLSDLGIGAIYLGNLSSPFDVRDSDNTLKGRIARTGLFFKEDGTPGTVQHLDVVV